MPLADFIPVLGAPSDDEALVALMGKLGHSAPLIKRPTTVQVYPENGAGFETFQGELPRGLDFDLSRAKVHALLGKPERKSDPDAVSVLDRWRFEDHFLFVEFTDDEALVENIALQCGI